MKILILLYSLSLVQVASVLIVDGFVLGCFVLRAGYLTNANGLVVTGDTSGRG